MKLTRTVTGLLSVALIAFMVSDALGQEGGRRGGGGRGAPGGGFQGGRGGPGGFGGRGGPGGGGDNTMALLQDEDVQVELEISPDQDEAIKKMAEQARGGRGEEGGRGFADIREMSEADRDEFFAKRRKEQEERTVKMKEQLEEVLLPEQAERLEQIKLQVRGVQALMDEEVAGKLKISADQKKKLTEVQEGVREKMGERMRELFASGDRDAMREAFAEIGKEVETELLDVLSSDQKKQFEEMKGELFAKAEQLRRGAGGFGGGRGGPGGGRGGPGGAGGGRGGRGGPGGGRGGRPQRPGTEE